MTNNTDLITDVRGFNRFYTNILGLLDKDILKSGYSLTEARVLFEIFKTENCTANALSNQLGIDASYMSRIIRKFERNGLILKKPSPSDSRSQIISLTDAGITQFHELDNRSNLQIEKMLAPLSQCACEEVRSAMNTIKKHLTAAQSDFIIRSFTREDVDYIITRQLTLYETERNFTSDIWVKYLTEGVTQLVERFDPEKDCIYILEYQGIRSGCAAVTHVDETTAQFRYFFLEPEMRGLGAGGRLLDSALEFCRTHQYQKVLLWTVSAQTAARRLYQSRGFRITETHENCTWGEKVLEERWDLELPCQLFG